jgi:hypothetical protein
MVMLSSLLALNVHAIGNFLVYGRFLGMSSLSADAAGRFILAMRAMGRCALELE